MSEKIRVIVTGRDYEEYVCDLLQEEGFNAELTPASCDKGVDILVRAGDHRIAIQCKLYSHPVGIEAVQEVQTGAAFYNCDIAFVVSPQPFTDHAKSVADAVGVEIIHHDSLVSRFSEFKVDKDIELFEMSPDKRQDEDDKINELMLMRMNEVMSSFRRRKDKFDRMLSKAHNLESMAQHGDIGALFKFARDGQEMEQMINSEVAKMFEEAEFLGIELSEEALKDRIVFPTQRAKEILVEIAKGGNVEAKSKLMELIKGRGSDEFVSAVFRDAIANGEVWVQDIKPWLAMYGLN